MRYIFCGGRDYDNKQLVTMMAESLPEYSILVNGGASGADWLAKEAGKALGLQVETYPAQWNTHGSLAGPMRNYLMSRLDDVALVIAFPGGRGTENMIAQAAMNNIEVLRVG
jgi:hypothetical protein